MINIVLLTVSGNDTQHIRRLMNKRVPLANILYGSHRSFKKNSNSNCLRFFIGCVELRVHYNIVLSILVISKEFFYKININWRNLSPKHPGQWNLNFITYITCDSKSHFTTFISLILWLFCSSSFVCLYRLLIIIYYLFF